MEKYCQKINFLKTDYPAVYIGFCKHYKRDKDVDDYIKECLKMRLDNDRYSQYIHGGVLPSIQKDREAGLIHKGKKIPKIQFKS